LENQKFKLLVNSAKVCLFASVCAFGIMLSTGVSLAAEEEETKTEETTDTEGENVEGESVTEALPAPSYDIPDNADFSYEEVLYKPIDHYDSAREPMNGERISVNYKGEVVPAYYWAPGDLVVFQVSLADTDIPKFEDLSQEDQDTWKSFLSDDYATPAEAYYAEMLPTYTFYFNFDENKIVPFVEFDYGKEGKVVMMPYDMDEQGFYLEELSLSFLKLGNFEFETYQFLSINDDSCYHILSCMDQVGNTYLYQYDANGNSCARADLNMLIGLRYLSERTIALNEYIDKVQAYQDNIRKIIAGVIIFVILVGFAFIYIVFGKRKKDAEDDEEEDEDEDDEDEDEDEADIDEEDEPVVAAPIENKLDLDSLEKEYGVVEEDIKEADDESDAESEVTEAGAKEPKEFDIDSIQIEEPVFDDEEENDMKQVAKELSEDGFVPSFEGDDSTEGGLFFAADTDEMKSLFKESEEEPKRGRLRAFLNGDDIEDDEDDDEYEDDEDDYEDEDSDVEDFEVEIEDINIKESEEPAEVEAIEEVETIEEAEVEATENEEPEEEPDPTERQVPEHQKKSLASLFEDDDDEDEDEEYEKPRRHKKEKKEKKVKPEKEKKVKNKPEKKKHHIHEDEDADDDEILDLEDL